MTAYTVGGLASSVPVGMLVAVLGHSFMPGDLRIAILLSVAVALAIAARELRLISLRVPQMRRQTDDRWAKSFRTPLAETLWGFDIGLTFSTRMVFGGAWVLACIAAVDGGVAFGALLFGSFWIGRVLPVWIGPLFMPNPRATLETLAAIHSQMRTLQVIHAAALLYAAAALTFVALSGA